MEGNDGDVAPSDCSWVIIALRWHFLGLPFPADVWYVNFTFTRTQSGHQKSALLSQVCGAPSNCRLALSDLPTVQVGTQKKRHSRKLQTALHHNSTTNRRVHVRSPTRKHQPRTQELAIWCSHHPAWMRASHGWVPVNAHSTPVPGLPGRLWVAHRPSTTAHHRHTARAQQHST